MPERNALTKYITARLELEADADRVGIAASGADPDEAAQWDWVRQGKQHRDALKHLLTVLNEKCGDGAAEALTWLASTWSEDPPLVDRRGLPYTVNAGGLTYLTECHLSAPTFSGTVLCCRVCYEEVDPVLLYTPDVSSADILWRDPVELELNEYGARVGRAGGPFPTEPELVEAARRAAPNRAAVAPGLLRSYFAAGWDAARRRQAGFHGDPSPSN